jgi:hypothetical protein
VAFDGTGKAAPLRFAHNLDRIPVSKDINLYLVTDRGFRLRSQADLFQNPSRRNTAARLFEMSAKRLRHILGPNRFVFYKAKLDSVVTVLSGGAFCLDNDAWAGFDHSNRSYRAILTKYLRHSDFSTNDSANHNFV